MSSAWETRGFTPTSSFTVIDQFLSTQVALLLNSNSGRRLVEAVVFCYPYEKQDNSFLPLIWFLASLRRDPTSTLRDFTDKMGLPSGLAGPRKAINDVRTFLAEEARPRSSDTYKLLLDLISLTELSDFENQLLERLFARDLCVNIDGFQPLSVWDAFLGLQEEPPIGLCIFTSPIPSPLPNASNGLSSVYFRRGPKPGSEFSSIAARRVHEDFVVKSHQAAQTLRPGSSLTTALERVYEFQTFPEVAPLRSVANPQHFLEEHILSLCTNVMQSRKTVIELAGDAAVRVLWPRSYSGTSLVVRYVASWLFRMTEYIEYVLGRIRQPEMPADQGHNALIPVLEWARVVQSPGMHVESHRWEVERDKNLPMDAHIAQADCPALESVGALTTVVMVAAHQRLDGFAQGIRKAQNKEQCLPWVHLMPNPHKAEFVLAWGSDIGLESAIRGQSLSHRVDELTMVSQAEIVRRFLRRVMELDKELGLNALLARIQQAQLTFYTEPPGAK
jgi:hypothetical protein